MFKRKIYNKIKEWKDTSQGKTALLIEGARRIGKSTVVEEFARNEYKSYILIDFSIASNEVKEMFEDMSDLNYFFLQLQLHYHVELENRNSVIIFDEVQLCPKARQAIKFLVKDGRYDYIETGSLISIKKNVKDILIPSEERKLQMHPMDYEEFLWALDDKTTMSLLKMTFDNKKKLGDQLNRKLMRSFRLYMLVGGMPQAVNEYIQTNNFKKVDDIKRDIINLYENAVAQILIANGHDLFYYTFKNLEQKRNYEIDFIISKKNKICPIEVKSSNYKKHTSIDEFYKKYSSRILERYIIHTKDVSKDQDILCLPIYLTQFIL